LARFLKLDYLPRVVMPEPRIRELRHLFTAREALVSMGRGLKNMGHAAPRATALRLRGPPSPQTPDDAGSRRLEGLAPIDRQMLDMVLRQLETVDREIEELERAIIRVGRHLPGVKRLLQVRGLGLIAAIGVLSEIGEVTRFPSANPVVAYDGLATAVRGSLAPLIARGTSLNTAGNGSGVSWSRLRSP
jgi:transposase